MRCRGPRKVLYVALMSLSVGTPARRVFWGQAGNSECGVYGCGGDLGEGLFGLGVAGMDGSDQCGRGAGE